MRREKNNAPKRGESLEGMLLQTGARLRDDAGQGRKACAARLRARIAEEQGIQLPGSNVTESVWALRNWIRTLAFGGAAAAVLVAGIVIHLGRNTPAGVLVHRSGTLIVEGDRLEGSPFSADTKFRTVAGASSLLNLDRDRVQLFIAPESSLQVSAARDISLEQGSLWVSVVPGSGPFRIDFGETVLEVTGTSFGLRHDPAQAVEVYLATGEIRLHGPSGSTTVSPGQLAVAPASGGAVALSTPPSDEAIPGWVSTLYGDYQKAYTAAYFPSTGPLER